MRYTRMRCYFKLHVVLKIPPTVFRFYLSEFIGLCPGHNVVPRAHCALIVPHPFFTPSSFGFGFPAALGPRARASLSLSLSLSQSESLQPTYSTDR